MQCRVCGEPFEAQTWNQKMCSSACERTHTDRRNEELRTEQTRRRKHGLCLRCGEPLGEAHGTYVNCERCRAGKRTGPPKEARAVKTLETEHKHLKRRASVLGEVVAALERGREAMLAKHIALNAGLAAKLRAGPMPASGVYFLMNEGEIAYIGESSNVFMRVGAHAQGAKTFDGWVYCEVEEEERYALEQALITVIRPPQNHIRAMAGENQEEAEALIERWLKQSATAP